ncbi:hypothetical protein [uncultured Roseobacter sp.]|uniref:hypothetical protein n=1 Tax=uncultured Roseobacter sp. TaxID=114847 RepID=UPI00260C37F1|nr:hypothetical protein [uncultured Roseobacter sp.]
MRYVETEHSGGTRFRLFPQLPSLDQKQEPETVWVSSPAGSLLPGPADHRMYVIDPVGKERAYGYYPTPSGATFHYRPPWDGPVLPEAHPDPEGHFDHLEIGTYAFEQAHAFGAIRFTMDIWEHYFERRLEWHFQDHYERLEILFLRGLDNAFAGFGSIEIGSYTLKTGELVEFGLSFDILSHELGHLIIYNEIGLPGKVEVNGEYFGFHESAADMVALISLLHFDSAVVGLLESTSGNLYSFNRLSRFGEVSNSSQLRSASNDRTLYEFTDGWAYEHDLSQVLTGALFDIWIDVFHENLLRGDLISEELEDLSDRLEGDPDYHKIIQPLFDEAYARNPKYFADALVESRDYMGFAMASVWDRLTIETLDFADVYETFLEVDDAMTGGQYHRIIALNMERRGIGVISAGPRLAPPDESSHAFSSRTDVPDDIPHRCGGRLPFRMLREIAQIR